MKTNENEKTCPVLSIGCEIHCAKERCAWFMDGACAVVYLGRLHCELHTQNKVISSRVTSPGLPEYYYYSPSSMKVGLAAIFQFSSLDQAMTRSRQSSLGYPHSFSVPMGNKSGGGHARKEQGCSRHHIERKSK